MQWMKCQFRVLFFLRVFFLENRDRMEKRKMCAHDSLCLPCNMKAEAFNSVWNFRFIQSIYWLNIPLDLVSGHSQHILNDIYTVQNGNALVVMKATISTSSFFLVLLFTKTNSHSSPSFSLFSLSSFIHFVCCSRSQYFLIIS